VKWLLAIPHYVVLFFLDIAAFVVVIVAWFAIVLTGTYPRGMFGFVEGVIRWNIRVTAYAFTLVTDRYPPFRLASKRAAAPSRIVLSDLPVAGWLSGRSRSRRMGVGR
jgi:hypothetical protein